MKLLSIFHFPGYPDPSAAYVQDGEVIAFIEEERLVRNKHAKAYFPVRAIDAVLEQGGVTIEDIDAITFGWDCGIHDSGELAAHFEKINAQYPPSEHDAAYQRNRVSSYGIAPMTERIRRTLRKRYGGVKLPPIEFINHHYAHAVSAFFHSGMEEALVLAVDGSGEMATTSWWKASGKSLDLISEVRTPHSLGWLYSAFTEFLGFDAYDGEYKVMGLAAYGKGNPDIAAKLEKVIWYDGAGGFASDPYLVSMGDRSYSSYFPDKLVEHMGRKPRAECDEISDWHISCAFEVQQRLESIIQDMTRYHVEKTAIRNLVVTGGVGLNVKMNGNLFKSGIVDDLSAHPLCSDTGICIGAAMAYELAHGELQPITLDNVNYGPEWDDDAIEKILKACKLDYTRPENFESEVASHLANGKIIGWFQGRMEAGPRSLGCRSILADPRTVDSRDRVNSVIKFREFWRPFCPSMNEATADRFLKRYTTAPFMIITFDATDEAAEKAPAIVHVDGTCRVQIVTPQMNPRYHALLQSFESITGIGCLLNTSFNIKGEPIVCTPHDAIRTFFATGLDALALGSFLIVK
ncbi:MAG: carbamoyltransferase [Verrucomicrobiales bacterium]|jgi:carbamoyltransferase